MGTKTSLLPVITEKSLEDVKSLNEYTFLVSPALNKHQIKEAVESAFGVKVEKVRTSPIRGKKKRVLGQRFQETRTPDMKKAFVKLSEKDQISLFEVEEGEGK